MYFVEIERNGVSTQLGEPVASVETAIATCAQRINIAVSLVGDGHRFRLTNEGNPLSETEQAAWEAGAAANGFNTY